MKKIALLCLLILFYTRQSNAQDLNSTFIESVVTFSSPKASDFNDDGVNDIVIGAGVDGVEVSNGIVAINGADGNVLWSVPARDEVFGTAALEDLTGDGIADPVLGGRKAQLYAINGSSGKVIWEYYSDHGAPVAYGNSSEGTEEKLLNFYSASYIPDQNNDDVKDLVVAYGGDHGAPEWETSRPSGFLMVLSGQTGEKLAEAVVPDGKEIYMSPVVSDYNGDGSLEILFGTGGETIGGSFYITSLRALLDNDISGAQKLLSNDGKGFIAPPALGDLNKDDILDFVVQGFNGTVYTIDGASLSVLWKQEYPGTESAAQPVIGNFTGSSHADVFVSLIKGSTNTGYTENLQLMLDGPSGEVIIKEGLTVLSFGSPIAADLNNDGREEVLFSGNFKEDNKFKHILLEYDFQNDNIDTLVIEDGNNLISTPLLVADTLFYVLRKDNQNPSAPNGFYIKSKKLNNILPAVWSGYLGNDNSSTYNYPPACPNNLISSYSIDGTSCNSVPDGGVSLELVNPGENYTFLWSDGSISPNLTNVFGGQYSVRVMDPSGCVDEQSFTVHDKYKISESVTHNDCPEGKSGSISVSSSGCACMTSNCTFDWTNEKSGKQISGLSSGDYTVTITHGDGCVVDRTINVGPKLFSFESEIVNEYNQETELQAVVKVTGGTPPYSIQWHDPSMQTGDTASYLQEGKYQVVVTDSKGCEGATEVSVMITSTRSPADFNALVYPNPAYNTISIKPGFDELWNWQILSIDGKTVKSGSNVSSNEVNVSVKDLQSGVYLLNVTSGGSVIHSKVVVK